METKIDIKKITSSKTFKTVIITVATLAVLSMVFQAGVFVGFHKASFLFKSGDNFYRTFGERGGQKMMGKDGMSMSPFNNEFSGGHGAVGKIVKINLPSLVVLGPDNIEKVILTNEKTDVRLFRETSSTTKLTIDQYITVLGTPNDQGEVVAKFIRIVPDPALRDQMSSSTKSY